MKNIKLNYRYRDADNYKQFGSVVFSNPSRLPVEEATALLLPKLISEEFFVPDDWGLSRLHASPYNPAVDHEWHEFEEFEETNEEATDNREIGEFLKGLVKGYEV
ncbi:hypothetical protein PBT90_02370 [Algoriphagus halophytocola]|uniref:Uncharacterized protein n=1 Tax=Algoriphagus halophytocola TaxID=2991499 RepID=A0ABY6MER5_9BACT|nr:MULTISPECIES: hypothetical protein [unclassified Algoriphagus]UZD22290.1 hypothetical protein OM944_16715 [Algoriphagus sp. TR-M5]WBL43537.1 hypothetical protein PBT90_02370 [Algoriphagus sp. TR-M9]